MDAKIIGDIMGIAFVIFIVTFNVLFFLYGKTNDESNQETNPDHAEQNP
ncbi:hypothetical protein SDC9_07872 [bioreactor metagenome]|uniref:Uncharacterized protein n=1 Tax=bioreactor metagenome TaxID=1076179 RepID=A0A644T8M9_9ZZZZ|nr:hypothetical protein [Candidatus Elulimicrobiales bacterium]